HDDLPAEAAGALPGLDAEVTVRYDRRGVPHIFAATLLDAFRAQGYVVARDRLFQLELQTRAGEGTLTELVGAVALPADRETRRLGMPRAAERTWAAMDTAGRMARVLQAYADGINAYRATLAAADYPVEYKLLGKTPRAFLPIHALHLFNRMGYTLASNPGELNLLKAQALIGDSAARALFDTDSPVQEPIQPYAKAPRSLAATIPAPGAPDTAAARLVAALAGPSGDPSPLEWARDPDAESRAQRAFASNNWAVAPARSASGKALLAGDPHLELTLPSIWYEMHLVVPDSMDVGGVSFPGMPGIAIGFTRAFAWSATNTGADVMDFWRETVDNPDAPTAYELDGAKVPLADTRIETYRDPKGRVIGTDTVHYTHRGPMRRQGREWLSMRWTVLEAGTGIEAFFAAMRATSAPAFLDSMAAYYQAPAQNWIVADTAGTIGIRSTGRYPVRADSGRGTVIRDGRTRAADWIGNWPVSRYPQAIRPAQGYLASANQQPKDPADDPLYLGADGQFETWRALQINRLLRADAAVTAEAMRRYHTDPGSVRAEQLAPHFVRAAQARAAAGDASPSLAAARAMLAAWDHRYTRDNTGAQLFETALRRATILLYDELVPAGDSLPSVTPTDAQLPGLMADSASAWWDRRATPARETRDEILAAALASAYDSLVVRFGDPAKTPWTWGTVAPAAPNHLLRLPGFAAPPRPIDGGRGTLNPSAGPGARRANYGASWRMVAEMDGQPRIRAVYPGGQSGNPGSPRYLDRFAMWADGQLDSVRTPRTPQELTAADTRAVLTLKR
ncbi:MAG: penicillin acylase family protein, partial [Gemmatimonadetes bacterium]|nr:penicillin acylase family protein [Gemmatimonadota bacterium]